MDTILHGVSTGVIVYAGTQSAPLAVASGVAAMAPDIAGIAGKVRISRDDGGKISAHIDYGNWEIYRRAHEPVVAGLIALSAFAIFMAFLWTLRVPAWQVFPPAAAYAVHLGIDAYWHKPGGGWKPWGVVADGALWIVILYAFWSIVL